MSIPTLVSIPERGVHVASAPIFKTGAQTNSTLKRRERRACISGWNH
jgi:hypothetical protein